MTWRIFQEPQFLPRLLIYDNGCRLYVHCEASGDTLHHHIGMPVDVFHWKSKHKKTDDACSIHCNPYNFPELLQDDKESWFFNTSVAEQTNVWMGGYHAILREMTGVKYDFFLDQSIMDKNELTRAKLAADGRLPDYRPDMRFSGVS